MNLKFLKKMKIYFSYIMEISMSQVLLSSLKQTENLGHEEFNWKDKIEHNPIAHIVQITKLT